LSHKREGKRLDSKCEESFQDVAACGCFDFVFTLICYFYFNQEIYVR